MWKRFGWRSLVRHVGVASLSPPLAAGSRYFSRFSLFLDILALWRREVAPSRRFDPRKPRFECKTFRSRKLSNSGAAWSGAGASWGLAPARPLAAPTAAGLLNKSRVVLSALGAEFRVVLFGGGH